MNNTEKFGDFMKNILIWKKDNKQTHGMMIRCYGGKELKNKEVKTE